MDELIPKVYTPGESEKRWYTQWIHDQLFASQPSDRNAFSILMPPPNVTGILHFGHVLNMTLQDIYIRWNRLQGKEACWFPGLDHAGIATQTKVEQELKAEGKTRYDLGREAFINRTWDWKAKYGGTIDEQMRTLGVSADWDRSLFTMDESSSKAVQQVFIQLFDEGLIYRGKRIINWSPLAQSALSDEEVIFKEVQESIYTLRYHLADGSGTMLISTVRPETIFADVALAVNPSDERYQHLIGKHVIIPLRNTHIPVIADEYADPAFGTGVVKITPAHDPNDFEVGLRHNLPMPSCINADATLNEMAGEFAGLDRFVARKKVVKALTELELLEKTESYTHNVGFSERGGEAVEPYLSNQWFVRMQPLAEPALKAVTDGHIKFHPEHWVKTYEHWMNNIRDWCISRQLWWGHRIPVYYTPDDRHTAASSEQEARQKLGIDAAVPLRRDEDVLDTWFSSWLWPLTTMGWDGTPGSGKQNREFYLPSDLLVTGPDIIFFWVARMIMATLKFEDQTKSVAERIPFKDVYFTSIIRDSKGRKLSKSLGNSPDPIGVIDKYGADAVRFTMIYLAPLGTDVRLDVDEKTQDIPSMELGRNFANKIWNVARFLQMKGLPPTTPEGNLLALGTGVSVADRWILSRYNTTIKLASEALADYRITEYARLLHEFVWRDFCDWYVEIFKVEFNNAATDAERTTLLSLAYGIVEGMLKLLHPVMPFVTEELWHGLFGRAAGASIGRSQPLSADPSSIDPVIEQQFESLQALVEGIRRQRAELKLSPGTKIPIHLSADGTMASFLTSQQQIVASLCKASEVVVGTGLAKPQGAVADVVRGIEVYLVVEGTIDVPKEKERLSKEIERLTGLVRGVSGKLANEGFVAKAKPEVVEAERKKLNDWTLTIETLQKNMDALV